MTVGRICNREVIVVNTDSSIVEAARLMRRYHVGDLVVVEERQGKNAPVGIVTDRDIVIEVVAKEVDLDSVSVGDVMSPDVYTAFEQDSISDVLQKMRGKGIRRLPVVDVENHLVGIVSLVDLLELLADELVDLSRIVNQEQRRERRQRS